MINYTPLWRKNQAQQKISSRNVLESRIKKLSTKRQAIIQAISYYDGKESSLWASHETIGNWVDLSREGVLRALKAMEREGLVESVYRHRHSSVYHLGAWFNNPFLRYAFYQLFPALKKTGLMLLLLSFTGNVTPLKSQSYKDLSFLTTSAYVEQWNKLRTIERMKLHAFSERALEFACWKSLGVPKVRNLFAYLLTVCLDRAKDLGEKPDWVTVERMKHMSEKIRRAPLEIKIHRGYDEDGDVSCYQPSAKYRTFKKEPQTVKSLARPRVGMYSVGPQSVVTQDRLMPRKELEQKLQQLESNQYGRIAAEVIRKKQREVYESLAPDQQEAWRQGK